MVFQMKLSNLVNKIDIRWYRQIDQIITVAHVWKTNINLVILMVNIKDITYNTLFSTAANGVIPIPPATHTLT